MNIFQNTRITKILRYDITYQPLTKIVVAKGSRMGPKDNIVLSRVFLLKNVCTDNKLTSYNNT